MAGKRIAIVQSNYVPWKGYFDLINMVDEFVLYDDVQYTRRSWRNRNRIRKAYRSTCWCVSKVRRWLTGRLSIHLSSCARLPLRES